MGTFIDTSLYHILREDDVTKVTMVGVGGGEIVVPNNRLEQLGENLVNQARINDALDELYRPKAE